MIHDLQSMTETELRRLSAEQFVEHILSERTETRVVEQVGDERGMLRYRTETRDYKGNLLSSELTLTSYHPDGSVDVITKVESDAARKEARRLEIAHDGQRAWVKADSAGEPVAPKEEETLR
jgi:hypothetical protein